MPIITLNFKNNKISEHPLEKGKSLTIGRRGSNDVVIENLAVSGYHAKIDSIGDGFVLTDLQSKNGCYVNDQMVVSHWLKPGDVISIGKHTLTFDYREGENRPEKEFGPVDQTMLMDNERQRNPRPKTETAPSKPTGVISFLSGGEGEVPLAKKLMKIGKDSAADIVIGGFGVGQTAATISHRPNGYFLSYVGGLSRVKVNGSAVKESVMLREFDVIDIGSAKLQFFNRESAS